MRTIMADHDHSYKQLFSNPELVRDLLQGFVHEDWVTKLDLTTLERVNGSYVSDDLREREDDIIWKVRFGSNWIYVYLLIEFQSTVDKYMALRIMTYLGLLYQDLQKTDNLPPEGKLPPVLPLVLYNGKKRWKSAKNITELIQNITGDLAKYQPACQYLLLEENQFSTKDLPAHNLVSAIFELEKSQYPEDIREVVKNLVEWLKSPEQTSIRRAFTVWIHRVLLPARLPGQEIPEANDLLEVENMLAERVKEWTQEWKEEGLQKGIQEGIQEGIQKGMQKGMQKAYATMLWSQLEEKFGTLSKEFKTKINQADDKQLLEWSKRILTASSLGDIFDN